MLQFHHFLLHNCHPCLHQVGFLSLPFIQYYSLLQQFGTVWHGLGRSHNRLHLHQPIHTQARQARGLQTHEGGEFGEEVGEDGVEQEHDEDPPQERIDQNDYKPVGGLL